MAIWLKVIHHDSYTPWSGTRGTFAITYMAISYTPQKSYTMVGEDVALHHGNMAIRDTPRQLYTMIGEDVANSPWQYGY